MTILHNGNCGGKADAIAAAIERPTCVRNEPTSHGSFVDEDFAASMVRQIVVDLASQAKLNDPRTAAVAPEHRERAIGLRARQIALRRWHNLEHKARGMGPVAFAINTLSVWRLAARAKIGVCKEWLSADQGDIEYSLRARAWTDRVLARRHRVRAVNWRAAGVLSVRQRPSVRRPQRASPPKHRTRRGLATVRYAVHEPALAVLCVARSVYEAVEIALAEDLRVSTLAPLCGGAFGGAHSAVVPSIGKTLA